MERLVAASLAAWLCAAGPATPPGRADATRTDGEIAILHLRITEGDAGAHLTGSRSARPLAVQVTDETGRPAEGVAVSFRMPEEGPSGAFASGLKSEILITDQEGRVAAWGIQWGGEPGPVRIRITAMKGKARAGMVSSQYLSDAVPLKDTGIAGPIVSVSKPRSRWTAIGVAAAGAAAAGLLLGTSRHRNTPAPPPSPQIGAPVITIGTP